MFVGLLYGDYLYDTPPQVNDPPGLLGSLGLRESRRRWEPVCFGHINNLLVCLNTVALGFIMVAPLDQLRRPLNEVKSDGAEFGDKRFEGESKAAEEQLRASECCIQGAAWQISTSDIGSPYQAQPDYEPRSGAKRAAKTHGHAGESG